MSSEVASGVRFTLSMKFETMKIALAALSGLTSAAMVCLCGSAEAATFTLQNTLDFAVPQPGELVVGGCAFPAIAICTPNDVAVVNTDPTRALPLISNDTAYTITGFVYKLDPTKDAIWGSASSNLFQHISFSDDRKTVTFSGGILNIGEAVRAIRTGGAADITYEVSFLGEPASSAGVPEPTTMAGVAIAGVGSLLMKRRQQS